MRQLRLRSSNQSLPTSLPIDRCMMPGKPWLKIAVFVCQTLALGACGSTLGSTSNTALPAPVATTPKTTPHSSTMRVIVKFSKPVPYNNTDFLNAMAQQIQAPVFYLSSLSTDTHVYLLKPQPMQKPADLLQQLSAMPAVLRVEVDTIAQPN